MFESVRNLFEIQMLDNTVTQWGVVLVVFTGGWIVLNTVKKTLSRQLQALAAKTANPLDDMLADLVNRTKFFFLLALALYATTLVLSMPPDWRVHIRIAIVVVALLQSGIWANGLVVFGIDYYLKQKTEEDPSRATVVGIGSFLGQFAVWSLVVLLVLQNLGINVTPLIAGLGVGGIAVGLAAQNILGDLFASLSLVLDRPFQVGDFIIVGDLLGTVEHIGLKTTRVRSLFGEQLVFSNTDLLTSRIRNYKQMQERRLVFAVGVTYQTPAEKLDKIPQMIREIIEGIEQTRFDRSHFQKFGDFALTFETVYYVLAADYNLYMDIQQRINLGIYRRFEAEGIEFAYPTQKLFLTQSGEG